MLLGIADKEYLLLTVAKVSERMLQGKPYYQYLVTSDNILYLLPYDLLNGASI